MSTNNATKELILKKNNYHLLLISLAIIVLGFLLMSGGGVENPNEFNRDFFSFRRISLAPIVLLLGYGLCIVAIMKKPKEENA